MSGALLVAAACGTDGAGTDGASNETSDRSPSAATATGNDAEASTPRENVPSALVDMTADGLPEPLVDPADVRSGGPPPDGIPPIDDPSFLDVPDVDFLSDNEPVLAFEIDGDARAYPIQIMIWHEIVNDVVGGVPVTVTYCPLCNTAVAVDRRLGERVLDFGTSGSLYQSALVMYDRQTESLWSHFTGEAIAGVLTGDRLERLPVATVAWEDWRDANPDGLVLSRDTGHTRNYGNNPYPGYDSIDDDPFLFDGEVDGRLAAKERVVAFGLGTDPVAVRLDPLLESGVVAVDVEGDPVVVLAQRGTASALDAVDVDGGRDVGATGVFRATHDGEVLGFDRTDDGFVDDVTGTVWDIFGVAVDGPLTGARLEQLDHLDTFWFAWGAFEPDTRLIAGPD